MNSPTQRSLKYLKDKGFTAQVVEKWNPYAHIRQDLFGFIDIVAIKKSENLGSIAGVELKVQSIYGIQATSTGNINARIKKILAIPAAKTWLEAGGMILVHGWSKKGKAGRRKTYQIKEVEITLKEFENDQA